MFKVLILLANGQLARHTTTMFLERTDARLTLYLRRASRLRRSLGVSRAQGPLASIRSQ